MSRATFSCAPRSPIRSVWSAHQSAAILRLTARLSGDALTITGVNIVPNLRASIIDLSQARIGGSFNASKSQIGNLFGNMLNVKGAVSELFFILG